MKKSFVLLMCMLLLTTACEKEDTPKSMATPSPTVMAEKFETLTIYSVDMDQMALIPIQVKKESLYASTSPKEIVDLVRDNLDLKIKIYDVVISNRTVYVSFAKDSIPLVKCSAKVERLVLDSFANSLLDNAKQCRKVVFRCEESAYKSKNLKMGKNEVYASE